MSHICDSLSVCVICIFWGLCLFFNTSTYVGLSSNMGAQMDAFLCIHFPCRTIALKNPNTTIKGQRQRHRGTWGNLPPPKKSCPHHSFPQSYFKYVKKFDNFSIEMAIFGARLHMLLLLSLSPQKIFFLSPPPFWSPKIWILAPPLLKVVHGWQGH